MEQTPVKQLHVENVLAKARVIPMRNLAQEIEAAQEGGRYCVIFDKNENANVYFNYKGTMKEANKLSVSVTIGHRTHEEALDVLRKSLVYSMRIGDVFAINCDNLNLNFTDIWTHPEILPMDEITDFDEWRENDSYMKIVKPEENVDLIGNKKCYTMNEKFTMVFLYKYTSDEDMVRIIDNIPNSEMMRFLITERQRDPTLANQNQTTTNQHLRAAQDYSFNAYDRDDEVGVGVRSFDVYERQYEQQLGEQEERKQWESRSRYARRR